MGRIVKRWGGVVRPAPAPAPAEVAAERAALLDEARAEAARLVADARPTVLALASKMAELIVGRAVALDPAVMAEIAAQALAATSARSGPVRLRAHPDDLPALAEHRAALAAVLAPEATLELAADETVARHGCVVETAVGRVDARLASQLAALQRAAAGDDGDG